MYSKQQPNTIRAMFDNIAGPYDLTNTILSGSMHKRWNKQLVKKMVGSPQDSCILLDLCSGTGDITFEYLKKKIAPCQAYLLDFSPEMLAVAKKKGAKLPLAKHKLAYLEADAQHIPLESETVDHATISYGIRNVQFPDKCFKEVFRVLKPGGKFGILELTRPTNPALKFFHKVYLSTFLPLLGRLVAKDDQAYQYLSESIQSFITPSEIEQELKAAGFASTQSIPLLGGVATVILSWKG